MKRLIVFGVVLSLVLVACASTQDGKRTQTEGTLVGAGSGALLGALIGGLAGGRDGALLGAAIGAGVGGTAGFAYGTHVANQKQKYASTEAWLDACIASADQVNQETSEYNTKLAREIGELDAETENLVLAYGQKKAQKSALVSERKKVDAKLAEANTKLDRAKFEIQNQEKVVAEATADGDPQAAAKLDTRIQELKGYVAELEGHTSSLASMSSRMAV